MIEVAETYRQWPLALGQQATYDLLVDGQSVAQYSSRDEAERDMKARRRWGITVGSNPDPDCPKEAPSQYCVFSDGYMVAGYPTQDEAEAYAERLRKEAGDANMTRNDVINFFENAQEKDITPLGQTPQLINWDGGNACIYKHRGCYGYRVYFAETCRAIENTCCSTDFEEAKNRLLELLRGEDTQ